MNNEAIKHARQLLNSKDFGILSTLSVKLGGFPFGSVVPYCLDGLGRPLVFMSTIAEHTKNISQDSRCSITIVMDSEEVQSNGRLCLVGNMEHVDPADSESQQRYFRHFPGSSEYSKTHNFSFYHLSIISIRYIRGFGSIHWLEPTDFAIQNPFDGHEISIVDHMNEDHLKSLRSYCEYYKKLTIEPQDQVRMASIDGLGFDVFVNTKKVRFNFDNPITNAEEARAAMVGLSKGIL